MNEETLAISPMFFAVLSAKLQIPVGRQALLVCDKRKPNERRSNGLDEGLIAIQRFLDGAA